MSANLSVELKNKYGVSLAFCAACHTIVICNRFPLLHYIWITHGLFFFFFFLFFPAFITRSSQCQSAKTMRSRCLVVSSRTVTPRWSRCTVVGMSSTWRTSTVRKEVVSAHAHTLSPHLLTQDSTSLNQANPIEKYAVTQNHVWDNQQILLN